jgi:hypothetical protein
MVRKLIVFAALLILIGIGIFLTPITKGQKDIKGATNGMDNKNEKDATIVVPGVVTDSERQFSKDYHRLYGNFNKSKLTDLAKLAKKRSNKGTATVTIGVPTIPSNGEPITSEQFITNLTCEADAVVFGTVVNKEGHMTDDQTFAYTQYEFLPQEIVKDNAASPIQLEKPIIVTRPGGLLLIDDQLISVNDESFEQLNPNSQYLLFLRFVPEANGYVASNPQGDFVLQDKNFKSISRRGTPVERDGLSSSELLSRNNIIDGRCKGGHK